MDDIDYPHKTCKRYNTPGHAHELTFSCYHRQPFLNDKQACQYLIEAIEKARAKYSFWLWAYVFMPDHVHMLIKPTGENYSISTILKAIKQPVSQKFKAFLLKEEHRHPSAACATQMQDKDHGHPAAACATHTQGFVFWQPGGGYDRNICTREAARNAVGYIHANPVRKKLVEDPAQWYYSSYKDWNDLGAGPIKIDADGF